MNPRTTVGFVADFPSVPNGESPAGRELAQFIVDALNEKGFLAESPDGSGGWAWEFYTSNSGHRILTTVGFVGDMGTTPPRQWLITNDTAIGVFKRLFGGTSLSQRNNDFLRRFCENIHEIIAADDRFSDVLWYDVSTFDKPNDQPAENP